MSETSHDVVEQRKREASRWTWAGVAVGVLIAFVAYLAGTDDVSPFISSIGLAALLGALIGWTRYWLAKRAT